jgi:hypothetical protein
MEKKPEFYDILVGESSKVATCENIYESWLKCCQLAIDEDYSKAASRPIRILANGKVEVSYLDSVDRELRPIVERKIWGLPINARWIQDDKLLIHKLCWILGIELAEYRYCEGLRAIGYFSEKELRLKDRANGFVCSGGIDLSCKYQIRLGGQALGEFLPSEIATFATDKHRIRINQQWYPATKEIQQVSRLSLKNSGIGICMDIRKLLPEVEKKLGHELNFTIFTLSSDAVKWLHFKGDYSPYLLDSLGTVARCHEQTGRGLIAAGLDGFARIGNKLSEMAFGSQNPPSSPIEENGSKRLAVSTQGLEAKRPEVRTWRRDDILKQLSLTSEYAAKLSLTQSQFTGLQYSLYHAQNARAHGIVLKWAADVEAGDYIFIVDDKYTGRRRGYYKFFQRKQVLSTHVMPIFPEKYIMDMDASGQFYDLPVLCGLSGEIEYGYNAFESIKGKITIVRDVTREQSRQVFGTVDGLEQELLTYDIEDLDIRPKDLIGMTPSQAIEMVRAKQLK